MTYLFRWVKGLWYARLRAIDRKILWPEMKKQAKSLEHARDAFAIHASNDHAYSDMTDEELADYIDNLV